MEQYISKSAVVAEIENLRKHYIEREDFDIGWNMALDKILSFLDTLEVKEVNIADMADEYYDALMEEAACWMDEGTMAHCRLAYYNGCKDVLAKLQKGDNV